jgi:hypothetical protein
MNGEPDAGDVRLKPSFDPMWSGRALIGRLRHSVSPRKDCVEAAPTGKKLQFHGTSGVALD